jgi:hypothetical protein
VWSEISTFIWAHFVREDQDFLGQKGKARPNHSSEYIDFVDNLASAIFPVPPLQQLGVMLRLRGIVHGAPEYVKNASVDVVAHLAAEFGVKRLRATAS